jgi:hypothetical protein
MSTILSRPRLWLAALILGHLLLTVWYSVSNPLGEAPDEADHWAYVFYLARERRLPEGPRVTQSKHPPLYHATAAAVASLAEPSNDFLRANPDGGVLAGPTHSPNFFIHTRLEDWPWQGGVAAFHLARLWSALISTLGVAAVYALARTALPGRTGVALLATGIAAALPEFAFIGGAVNNDAMAALFATLALWGGLVIYQRGAWAAGWWTGPALGLALLAKVSTSTLWPVVALALVWGAARRARAARPVGWLKAVFQTWRTWVIGSVAIFAPAALLVSPWLARNWRLYGDPLGMALTAQTVDLRTGPWGWPETAWLLRGWFVSFWGKFGGAGHIPFPTPVYWALAGVTLLAAAGLGLAWRREPEHCGALALLGLAFAGVGVGIWRYSLLALGTDQGRLLFPALGPAAILLAVGLSAWPWGRLRVWLGSGVIVALFGLAIYGLLSVIRPAFAPPPAPTTADLAAATTPAAPVSFGDLTLIGWDLGNDPVLYWRTEMSPIQDYRTLLRVLAADGTPVWEWRRSPGYGRFSTDRWPAGGVVADHYMVGWPDWAGPGRYQVEVTVYPYGGDPLAPAVMLGEITR